MTDHTDTEPPAMEPGESALVLCPRFDGEEPRHCASLSALDGRASGHLAIALTQSPGVRVGRLAAARRDWDPEVGVVHASEVDPDGDSDDGRSARDDGRAMSSAGGAEADALETVETVDVPLDPTRLGVATTSALSTLSREIIKDVEDIAGDREEGLRTLPVAIGERRSLFVAAGALALAVLASPVPYFTGTFGVVYLVAVLPADAVMTFAAYEGFSDPTASQSRLKYGMFLAAGAFIVGRAVVAFG